MYLYDVGYGTYEESSFRQWQHAQKFSKEELAAKVEEALWLALYAIASRTPKQREAEYIFVGEDGITFQHLLGTDQFVAAMEQLGFTQVQFQASWSVFGWASTISTDSWRSTTDEEHIGLVNRLKQRCDAAGIIVVAKDEITHFLALSNFHKGVNDGGQQTHDAQAIQSKPEDGKESGVQGV